MKTRNSPRHRGCYELAFSLIEIMVTVGLLSVIVLGLLAMFTQTRRAFTSSRTQTDVLEAGRAVSEMMARDLEQLAAAHVPNLRPNYLTTNFFAELTPGFKPIYQGLPGTVRPGGGGQYLRTNFIQRFFFLSQLNNQWSGTGYQVIPDDPSASGLGTLYRVTAKTSRRAEVGLLSSNFNFAFNYALATGSVSNLNRIAGGVIHMRVTAFATNGFPILPNGFLLVPDDKTIPVAVTNSFCRQPYPGYHDYYFFSNAIPAYLELELGILEPSVVERYKSMSGNLTAQMNYISNRVAQVHIFRQRIPIRNVDYHAYQ
jgi:hypothetical protein